MSLTKADISKKISTNADFSIDESLRFLDQFINIIKSESMHKKIKISNFGSFYIKDTVKRIGRNPKTKESYIIGPSKKLNFTSSYTLKKFLNL
jgi:integration host factor subunit alpha